MSEKLGAKSPGGLAYLLFATWLTVLCTGNQQYGRIYEDKLAVLSKSALSA